MKVLRCALAILVLLLSPACADNDQARIERWIHSRPEITLERIEPHQHKWTTIGWTAHVTARPGISLEQLDGVVRDWPATARNGISQLQITAPGLRFTAVGGAEANARRWEAALRLHRTLPTARLEMIAPQETVIRADGCEVWSTLDASDPVQVLDIPDTHGLTVNCEGPTAASVSLSPEGLTELASARSGSARLVAAAGEHTGWSLSLGAGPTTLTIRTPRITNAPSQAEVATTGVILTLDDGRVRTLVDARTDHRAPAQAAGALDWVTSVDATLRGVEVHGDHRHLADLSPVATRFPELTWTLWTDQVRFRSSGAVFGDRVRQYQALRDGPVDLGSITLIDDPATGRPRIEVHPPIETDPAALCRAIRGAAWQGEMMIEIHQPTDSSTSGVSFMSTARGAALGTSPHRPPRTRAAHESDAQWAVVEAWNSTAG